MSRERRRMNMHYGFMMVKIRDVYFNPKNTRDMSRDQDIENLAKSIETHGLINPIIVVDRGDRYELVAGERRLIAVESLGSKEIGARVLLTESDLEVITHEENEQRVDLRPLERAEAVMHVARSYSSGPNIDNEAKKKAAEKLCRSTKWIEKKLSLLKLSNSWREEVDDPNSPASRWSEGVLYLLSRMSKREQEQVYSSMSLNMPVAPTPERMMDLIAWKTRRVDNAPWSHNPEEVDGSPSACRDCLKRSCTQQQLFDDLEEGEVLCLDSSCWHIKMERHLQQRAGQLPQDSLLVVSDTAPKHPVESDLEEVRLSDVVEGEGVTCLVVSGVDAGREFEGRKTTELEDSQEEERARKTEKLARLELVVTLRRLSPASLIDMGSKFLGCDCRDVYQVVRKMLEDRTTRCGETTASRIAEELGVDLELTRDRIREARGWKVSSPRPKAD